jgi:glycosyltransferase involved in cell wall biosynthesis
MESLFLGFHPNFFNWTNKIPRIDIILLFKTRFRRYHLTMAATLLNEIVFQPNIDIDIETSGGLHKYAAIIKDVLKFEVNSRGDLFTLGSRDSITNTIPGYRKTFFYWDCYGISLDIKYKDYFLQNSGCIVVPDLQDLDLPLNFDKSALEFRKSNWDFIKNLDNFTILAMSNFTKNSLMSHLRIPNSKIKVIGAGLNARVPSLVEVRSDIQDLVRNKKYILLMSKFWKHKNVQDLFSSIKGIDKICEDNDLFIFRIGGRDKNELESISSRRVLDLGFRSNSEVTFLLQNAKALIHPSTYEGFCMPIGEALYLNIPVSAFNIESIRELVGESYPLTELGDYHSLLNQAIKLSTDGQYKLQVMSNINSNLGKMTWENIAADIYRELIRI